MTAPSAIPWDYAYESSDTVWIELEAQAQDATLRATWSIDEPADIPSVETRAGAFFRLPLAEGDALRYRRMDEETEQGSRYLEAEDDDMLIRAARDAVAGRNA